MSKVDYQNKVLYYVILYYIYGCKKQLIASKIKEFVNIIYVCELCIFSVYIRQYFENIYIYLHIYLYIHINYIIYKHIYGVLLRNLI